jgi:hypothetical protein
MGDALASLEAQYIFLTNHLDDYLDACKSDAASKVDADQDSVRSNYVTSRKNYWGCIKKIFHDDDPEVVAAVEQVKSAQTALEDSLDNLEEVATVLNTIGQAVKVGGELASLAA